MLPARRDPTDPREWLRRAVSNLVRARADRPSPDVLYDDLCFDAQQAAEKAIKAVLVHRSIDFPKTHDIGRLLTLATQAGVPATDDLQAAAALTPFAAAGRYPTSWGDVDEDEYRDALRLAERVELWAESLVAPQSPTRT
jgi:HEPN domain-containing protein